MKYRLVKKGTAVLLLTALVITGIPMEGFQSMTNDGKSIPTVEVEAKENGKEKEPEIVKELKNLQTENSNTYLLSNGSKRVEYYNNNIRYKKNGKYVDYNPALKKLSALEKEQIIKESKKKNTEEYIYTNISGDAKQYFSKDLRETGVLLKKDKYSVSFIPKETKEKQSEDSVEDGIRMAEIHGEEIVYGDEGSDIQYKYTSNYDGIKEEIVLHEYPEKNNFSFEIQAEDLELAKMEYDKTIRIIDTKTKKQVAYIDEPNIRDKSGKVSYGEVDYELEKVSESKYELSVVVDEKYLEKAEYPVVIDPTVVWFDSRLESATVSNMPYSMDFTMKNTTFMEVQNKCNPIGPYVGTEKYCYIDTTNILSGNTMSGNGDYLTDMYVEKATLRLREYEKNGYIPYQGNMIPWTAGTVEVRSVAGQWSPDTMTWNNHPNMGEKVWAQFSCTGIKLTEHFIDLTDWAKAVVSRKIPNYGLALKAKEENTGDTFYSSRINMVSDDAGNLKGTYMYLTIDYRDAGRYYGIDGVYAPTGNYSKTSNDMSIQTVLGDISITRTYNSLQQNNHSFIGNGFALNYGMKAIKKGRFVRINMPDSARWNFEDNGSGGYISLDNKGVLTYENDRFKLLLTLDMTEYGFNTEGYLSYIKDDEGNQLNISTDTKGQILNITDISGTKIVFSYSNDKLVKIEDIKNNSVIQTVSYVYNEDNLVKVVYPGGMENHYEYTDNRLTRISSSGKDSQGKIKECDIAYYTSGQYEGMVQSVTDTIDVTTAYTYDFENHITVVSDSTTDNANVRKMRYTYNNALAVTKEEDLNLEINDKQVNEVTYENPSSTSIDPDRPASSTDQYGNITYYEYDDNGNLIKTTYPDGSTETATYDMETNDLLTSKDRNGLITENTYSEGLLSEVKTGGLVTEKYTYYSENDYGIEGLIKEETDIHGNVTAYTYDTKGNVITTNQKIDGISHITTNTYDAKGQLIKTVDPEGVCTEYIYNESGTILLTRVKDRNGANVQITRNVHDVLGREIQVIDPMEYDAAKDNLDADIYSDSSVGIYTTYNSKGQVVSERDALGNTTEYVYDADGNVIKEIKPNGSYYTSEYDKDGRKIQEKFHENEEAVPLLLQQMIYTEGKNEVKTKDYIDNSFVSTTIQEYDWEGNVIKEIAPSGAVTTSNYENGLLIKEQMDDGSFTKYTYDEWGRTLTETESFDETGDSKTLYTYDDYGNVIMEREKCNADGEQTRYQTITYAYDSQDNEIKSVDEAGRIVQRYYRWDGEILREYKGMKKPLTIHGLDDVDNPYNQNYSVIKYEYDTMGRLQKKTDALGKSETYVYDKSGRQIKMTDRNGTQHITEYDSADNPVKEISGSIIKEYTYDCMGNIATEKEGDTTTTYLYDGRNNCIREEEGNIVKTYLYNNSDMVTEYTIYVGNVQKQKVSNVYDVSGNKTQVYENGNLKALYEYNKWGQLLKITNSNGTTEINTYNLAGLVTSVMNKKSNKVLSSYAYKYYYDGSEKMKTDISGTTLYCYDGEGLKKEIKRERPADNTVKDKPADIDVNIPQYIAIEKAGENRYYRYTPIHSATYTLESYHCSGDPKVTVYDTEGNTITQNDDGGQGYNFSTSVTLYAGIDYIIAVQENSGKGCCQFILKQDVTDNTEIMYAKVISEDIPEYVDLNARYQMRYYEITASVSGTYIIQASDNNGEPWLSLYDSTGNRLAGGNAPGTFDRIEYSLTAGEHYIIGAKVYAGTGHFFINVTPPDHEQRNVTEYTYDGNGNRLSLKECEDGKCQETTYTYDENDRLLTEKTGDKTVTYTYDNNGNMLETSKGIQQIFDEQNRMESYSKDGITTNYSYYADDMRKSKKNGTNHEIKYIWMDEDIAIELENSEVRSSYVYGEKLICSTYGWYLYNNHGDVTALTDNAGTVIKNYEYNSFGVQKSETDDADENPYRYSGEYYDAESGYTYLRARYYDPDTGRFISEDPALDGENWYVYCDNDPVNMVDPTGMWGGDVHKAMTRKAFNKIRKKLGWEKGEYPEELLEGCVIPDGKRKYRKQHKWHGHKGYASVKNKQLEKAVKLWKKGKKERAYTELGKGLHTIQDHNAHTFQRNGKTVNTWSYAKERFYIDKKTGAVIAGKYPQYINKKFMNSLENSGKDYLGKVVHKFTADNKNVTFNNKKNVWVWKDKKSKRYYESITSSTKYLKKFAKKIQPKKKKSKKKNKKKR